jgi:hypothetical protein
LNNPLIVNKSSPLLINLLPNTNPAIARISSLAFVVLDNAPTHTSQAFQEHSCYENRVKVSTTSQHAG